MKQKTISLVRRKPRTELLHVETPLGIVNIYVGLTDTEGRRVERIEIIPNDFAGEPKVLVEGVRSIRLVEETQQY
jgi:hypothetical protein